MGSRDNCFGHYCKVQGCTVPVRVDKRLTEKSSKHTWGHFMIYPKNTGCALSITVVIRGDAVQFFRRSLFAWYLKPLRGTHRTGTRTFTVNSLFHSIIIGLDSLTITISATRMCSDPNNPARLVPMTEDEIDHSACWSWAEGSLWLELV